MTRYHVIRFSIMPIVFLIFAGYFVVDVAAQGIPSPLSQIRMGVEPADVQCGGGLLLVIRTNDMPACVKPSTADILDQRGMIIFIQAAPPTTEKPIPPNGKEAQDIIESNNRFMLDYYALTSDETENVFFSPWSMLSAFSVVYEGAVGRTADEIASAIYLPRDDVDRRSSFLSMQQALNADGSGYELRNANALWIMHGFGVKESFVNAAANHYGSEVAEVEFPADESRIDSWVENRTNNKIKDLISGKTDEMTRLVITNAVYFKGTWSLQFDANQTSHADFSPSADETVSVPMMYQQSRFGYAENDLLQALLLQYEGERLSMIVLLPKYDLKSLEESMTWEEIRGLQSELREQEVIVHLPKFKIETEYDLKEKMQDLGMTAAFDPQLADLSGIADVSPDNLYIQFATHKAFIEVNEEGTEAAAATGIGVGVTSAPPPPPVFRADHPFVFMIQDNETGLVLFMGKVTDPS